MSTAPGKSGRADLQLIQRRAMEVVNWGIPVVNYDLMLQAGIRIGASLNQIVYWSKFLTWKNQTLTPNPDVIYFMPFFSTRDAGPLVLEIPPAGEDGSITGTIMDCWQTPLEDVGPAGVDKGQGGKYLILPPGFKDPVPAGYIPLRSVVYQGYALLRSILKGSGADFMARAVAYGKRIRLYPLAAAASPPATKMVDSDGKLFDATIPYDLRFFRSLDRMVQAEPLLPRDRAMIDLLAAVGIVKEKPFKPDATSARTLKRAAVQARAQFDRRYESEFKPYNKGHRWFLPADQRLLAAAGNGYGEETGTVDYPVDGRGLAYYFAYSAVKHMGAGQFYLFVPCDGAGKALLGSSNYRLRVSPHPPVRQYWSVVLYDFATHALIRGVRRASRSSQSAGLQSNADGSVDVYFGPKAPKGLESNWIPTKRGGRFEALFRFYGPEKPLFDKAWVLNDIEKLKRSARN